MKIYYVGKNGNRKRELLNSSGDILILGFDRWDDFDFKTMFPTTCRMNGELVELDSIKILFEGQKVSYAFLDELILKGWSGEFPVPDVNYISLPEAITFYEQIDGHLSHKATLEVAKILRDASYMVWVVDDGVSRKLAESEGFVVSLQRERGAKSSYINAWKFFNNITISVSNFKFRFYDSDGEIQDINFEFDPGGILPHDINVLIGPNGVGKSQTLTQMVESWLNSDPEVTGEVGFARELNVNQIIVVSYSPFERFPVDTKNINLPNNQLLDKGVYKYFGLRGRTDIQNKEGKTVSSIRLSKEWPKRDSANSLIACVSDDQRYGQIKDWSAKVETMHRVLSAAIDFDYAALVIEDFPNEKIFFDFDNMEFVDSTIKIENLNEKKNREPVVYIPISADRVESFNVEKLLRYVRQNAGVVFLKDGKAVPLSSGQRLFSYIVINILGSIRRNSLILIDEPELFLHPTLEISFIAMLKDILASFGSKAILATHSLVTVRELPRDCVHVFEKTDGGLFINHPPFETFGGDIQRISSYVFGDKSVSKPFETLLKEKLKYYGSAAALIEALGDDINEEMIIQISAMEAGKW